MPMYGNKKDKMKKKPQKEMDGKSVIPNKIKPPKKVNYTHKEGK